MVFNYISKEFDLSDRARRFHCRTDNLSQEQYDLIIENKLKATQIIIGGIEQATTSQKPHYHFILIFKELKSRKQVIQNYIYNYTEFQHAIYNNGLKQYLGGDYYLIPKYKTSSDSGFEGYVIKESKRYDLEEEILKALEESGNKIEEDKPEPKLSKTEQCYKDMILKENDKYIYTKNDLIEKYGITVVNGLTLRNLWHTRSQQTIDIDTFDGIFITGGTGKGKSAIVKLLYIGNRKPYRKILGCKWFNNYDNEKYIWLDELDTFISLKQMGGSEFMKLLCSNTGLPVEIKGSEIFIRPYGVIITSNLKDIQALINTINPRDNDNFGLNTRELQAQLSRRFFEIDIDKLHEVYNTFCYPQCKITGFGGVYRKELIDEINEFVDNEKQLLKEVKIQLKMVFQNNFSKYKVKLNEINKKMRARINNFQIDMVDLSRQYLRESGLLYEEGTLENIVNEYNEFIGMDKIPKDTTPLTEEELSKLIDQEADKINPYY